MNYKVLYTPMNLSRFFYLLLILGPALYSPTSPAMQTTQKFWSILGLNTDIGKFSYQQACRYLVINSGTSQSPEFTRQRDRYACGALAALRPFNFKSPTGLKINTTTMADAFSDALYFSYGKTSGLRLPGTTRLGVPPSLARSD